MKYLILIALISCGNQEIAKVKDCGLEPMGLDEAKVGDNIGDPKFGSSFNKVTPSVYKNYSYTSKVYLFNEYNTEKANWCYWYSVTTHENTITDIYVGNK